MQNEEKKELHEKTSIEAGKEIKSDKDGGSSKIKAQQIELEKSAAKLAKSIAENKELKEKAAKLADLLAELNNTVGTSPQAIKDVEYDIYDIEDRIIINESSNSKARNNARDRIERRATNRSKEKKKIRKEKEEIDKIKNLKNEATNLANYLTKLNNTVGTSPQAIKDVQYDIDNINDKIIMKTADVISIAYKNASRRIDKRAMDKRKDKEKKKAENNKNVSKSPASSTKSTKSKEAAKTKYLKYKMKYLNLKNKILNNNI